MADTAKFQPLNRNNSSVDCSISQKFGTKFDHVTADAKVQGKRVKDQGRSET